MKQLLAVASALALALALGVANAAEMKGKVEKVSADHMWFTLTGGMQFSANKNILKGVKSGSEVLVTYDVRDGKNVASKVAKIHTKTSKQEKKSY